MYLYLFYIFLVKSTYIQINKSDIIMSISCILCKIKDKDMKKRLPIQCPYDRRNVFYQQKGDFLSLQGLVWLALFVLETVVRSLQQFPL